MEVSLAPVRGADSEPLVRELALMTSDMAVEAGGNRIWATVGSTDSQFANSLVAINPATASVEKAIPLGAEPARLALPARQPFAWVVLNNGDLGHSIARVNLESGSMSPLLGISGNPSEKSWIVDFFVAPDDSELLVVAGGAGVDGLTNRVSAFKDGVKLPKEIGIPGLREIVPSTEAGFFWSYGWTDDGAYLYRLNLGSDGVTIEQRIPRSANLGTVGFVQGGHLLFMPSGEVIDGATGARVGWLGNKLFSRSAITVEIERSRVYIASLGTLYAYDTSTLAERGSVPLKPSGGGGPACFRWGEKGIVVRDSQKISFIESSLVPTGEPGDLALELQPPLATANLNQSIPYRFTIRNLAKTVATNARLIVSWSPGGSIRRLPPSNLPAVRQTDGATVFLGNLEPGAAKEVILELATGLRSLPFTVTGVVEFNGVDQAPANDAQAAHTLIGIITETVEAGATRIIGPQAKTARYSTATGLLYMVQGESSIRSADSLIAFDPVNSSVKWHIPLGFPVRQMEMSRDGRYLYISNDSQREVHRLNTRTGQIDLQFYLGPRLRNELVIHDMVVDPSDPDVLVLAQGPELSPIFSSTVGVYHRGIPRGEQLSGDNLPTRIEASGTPGIFWGVSSLNNKPGLFRLAVNETGIRIAESRTGLALPVGTDLKALNNTLFLGNGEVMDGQTLQLKGHLPRTVGSLLIETEASNNRVYSLENWLLRVIDAESLDLAITANVKGRRLPSSAGPQELIRWGADGLAIPSGGSLVLLQSTLIPPVAVSPLQVKLTVPNVPLLVEEGFDFHATLKNESSRPLTGVGVEVGVPDHVKITRVAGPQVTCTIPLSRRSASCQVGELAPGEEMQLVIGLYPLRAGSVTATVLGLVNQTPTSGTGGQASVTLSAEFRPRLDSTQTVALRARDMTFVQQIERFFLTVPGPIGSTDDTVVGLDPRTGLLDAPIQVGSGANRIETSDDGQFLYVGADRIGKIQRIDVAKRAVDLEFDLGAGPSKPLAAQDLVVLKGQPDVIVAVLGELGSSASMTVAAFHGNGKRPVQISLQPGPAPSQVELATNPNVVWVSRSGFPDPQLLRLNVTPEGVAIDTTLEPLSLPGNDILSAGGLLFIAGREVFDEKTLRHLGRFPAGPVWPDFPTGRAYRMGPGVLEAFDLTTFRPVAGKPLTETGALGARLVRWGSDGLATRGASQILLMRNSSIPSGPATDLAVTVTAQTETTSEGLITRYRLTGRNLGTNDAPNARFTLTLPPGADLQREPSEGEPPSIVDGAVHVPLGTLLAGASVERMIPLKMPPRGIFHAKASIAADVLDARPSNDAAPAVIGTGFPLQIDEFATCTLPSRSVIAEPTTGKLLFSLRSNLGFPLDALAVFNPVDGKLESLVELGSEPNLLAVSDDGRFVYVSRDAPGSIYRVDLAKRAIDLEFLLGGTVARDMFAVAGRPETLVVSTMESSIRTALPGVTVYDAGVPRPTAPPAHVRIEHIEPSPDANIVWGYTWPMNFFDLELTAEGLVIATNKLIRPLGVGTDFGTNIRAAGTRVYTTTGWVVDPKGGTTLGEFLAYGSILAPDLRRDKTLGFTSLGLTVFDNKTFEAIGVQVLPEIRHPAWTLELWGDDGVVMKNSEGQTFIGRTSLGSINGIQDSDGDGLPDVWELQNNFDPKLAADAASDKDGDGATALQEFHAGTRPNDNSDVLKIRHAQISRSAAGNRVVQVQFPSAPRRTYRLEAASALNSAWMPVKEVTSSEVTGMMSIDLPYEANSTQFIRVMVVK